MLEFDAGERELLNMELKLDDFYDGQEDSVVKQPGDIQEEDTPVNLHWSIIRHKNKVKGYWDIFIILLVLFNCYTIPMEVAFANISWMHSSAYAIAEYCIDVSFAIDIVLSFRTTFETAGGNEEFNPKVIAKTYLCGKDFIIDLLATIPFELVFLLLLPSDVQGGDLQTLQQLLGMLKLVRLLRLRRIVKLMSNK